MPAELLPPLFAVVLAVNALFVGLAIRSLWRSRDGEPHPRAWIPAPGPGDAIGRSVREADPQAKVGQPSPAEDEMDPVREADPDEVPDGSEADAVARTPEIRTGSLTMAAAPEPEPETAAEPPAPERSAPEHPPPARPPRRRSTPTAPAAGSRRRFALPPLDEDHEKVRRSIETFLDGAGTAAPAAVRPDPASILTVAVIGLAGPDRGPDPRRLGPARASQPDDPAGPTDLRAMLERTVRSTARGTDRVVVDRHGRVRVILPGTGELAAHAYLRRIRAIVEPIAEAALPPTRVVVATATDLGGSVASARRRADRRFAAAIQGPAGSTTAAAVLESRGTPGEHLVEPRAAGD